MENAKPTSSLPWKAPMVWPPIFWLTTNMRSGTRSTSSKFQTSFCSATQALSSSMPTHLRMVICSVPCSATLKALAPPGSWPAATNFPFLPGWPAQVSDLVAVTALPSSQTGGGIFCSSCAEQIRDRRRDNGQYSPAQKTDHRLRLPHGHAVPWEFLASQNRWTARFADVPATPASLQSIFQTGLALPASQTQHARP